MFKRNYKKIPLPYLHLFLNIVKMRYIINKTNQLGIGWKEVDVAVKGQHTVLKLFCVLIVVVNI